MLLTYVEWSPHSSACSIIFFLPSVLVYLPSTLLSPGFCSLLSSQDWSGCFLICDLSNLLASWDQTSIFLYHYLRLHTSIWHIAGREWKLLTLEQQLALCLFSWNSSELLASDVLGHTFGRWGITSLGILMTIPNPNLIWMCVSLQSEGGA